MELIKALLTLISVLCRLPVALVQRYQAEQDHKRMKEDAVQDLLHQSMIQFYEFLLTREELSDMDIAYLLREHKQRVRPCIADIVRKHKGESLSTNAVLAQAMRQALSS